MNILVTHLSPDLDALSSCWLIQRYLPGWEDAEIKFVSAGSTYLSKAVDTDKSVIHVDTGLGLFDHHQTKNTTSATQLVFEFLSLKKSIPKKDIRAVERLVTFVTGEDHFQLASYPEANLDRYDLTLGRIIEGLKASCISTSSLIPLVYQLIEASLTILRLKVLAETEIEKGYRCTSSWGKTLIMDTGSSEALSLAIRMGYQLVVKRDPHTGAYRIKAHPKHLVSLKKLLDEIKKHDTVGGWYLHPSGKMLLNATANNPNLIPSPLPLKNLIEIIRSL